MLLIQLGMGLTLIDPHGDLADDLERHCASLPDRIRRRVIVIRYCQHRPHRGHEPAVHRPVCRRRGDARRPDRQQGRPRQPHPAACLGRDGTSTPSRVLFKWTMRFLTMLARVGMTIADVRHFFDVGSPVYQALAGTAPDLVSRLEMEELADMRPRDREDFIASTKNRFLGFLENPIIELGPRQARTRRWTWPN